MTETINLKDLIKNLLRHDYEGVKELRFIESEPESVEVHPWDCSMGTREDELSLLKYSPSEGFKQVKLPTQWQAVCARQREEYWWVPYYHQEWAKKENLKGTYVLIKRYTPGSWEINESEGESTYDEYVTAWIFEKVI